MISLVIVCCSSRILVGLGQFICWNICFAFVYFGLSGWFGIEAFEFVAPKFWKRLDSFLYLTNLVIRVKF